MDEVFKLGFGATELVRVQVIRDNLGKFTKPASGPVPLMGVFKTPSTNTSGALTSSNTISGKRDHSQDGQRQDKRPKTDTARIQADAKRVPQGNTKHQAEIKANINENNNEVPQNRYHSTDVCKQFKPNENWANEKQSRGPTFQGGASAQPNSIDPMENIFSDRDCTDIKGNWRRKKCRAWNVGCSRNCQMCRIIALHLKLGNPNIQPPTGRH